MPGRRDKDATIEELLDWYDEIRCEAGCRHWGIAGSIGHPDEDAIHDDLQEFLDCEEKVAREEILALVDEKDEEIARLTRELSAARQIKYERAISPGQSYFVTFEPHRGSWVHVLVECDRETYAYLIDQEGRDLFNAARDFPSLAGSGTARMVHHLIAQPPVDEPWYLVVMNTWDEPVNFKWGHRT